jgi:spermidine synthase
VTPAADPSIPLPEQRAHPDGGPRMRDARGIRRATVELFLISFLVLFFELTCIRWFGSIVIFLTFFTNIMLMACFLGVSVGCLAATRPSSLIHGFIPGVLVAVVLAYSVVWCYFHYEGRVMIAVGSQKSPDQVYFGADTRIADPARFVVPIEAVAGAFFVLIALVFVGPRQVMGRRFDAIPDRLIAYSADILGSLAGIAAFSALSYWQFAATFWFAISLAIGLYFAPSRRLLHVAAALGALYITAYRVDWPQVPTGQKNTWNTWSPYNFVSYQRLLRFIYVNNMAHQGMLRVEESGAAYMLPYLLNRDAGGRSFEDVLIIGAGSGNDVAAALRQGAKHIDAVEIDPVIHDLGRQDHPNRPYRDPRVQVHLEDGRSFVRKTQQRYDLIVYALVDSLALHSSYSSVRLESFLFTEEAFRDVKAKLKPGGVFALYNFYRQGWVVGRLEKLVEEVFGASPIVISLPYQEAITADNQQKGYITFLLVGRPGTEVVEAIRSRLEHDGSFWLNTQPRYNEPVNGYGPFPPRIAERRRAGDTSLPRAEFKKIGLARVDISEIDRIPTDDWPFLYLRRPMIPALNLRGMAIVAALSLAILVSIAPLRRSRPNGQMFFVGAGFMLLETKGVVHMALLFGATWMVNAIVFSAILSLILGSNLYVLGVKPTRLWPYYTLLIASLGVSSLVPMADLLALAGHSKMIVSCAVVFLPIFFAGVIFATAFRSSYRPDVDFGSNVGGIILGGSSEYFSLVLGFNHLLFVAFGYYILSAILCPKGGMAPQPTGDISAWLPAAT